MGEPWPAAEKKKKKKEKKKEVPMVVAVGVCEKNNSKRAFKWALDNLVGVNRFVLVHVSPPITSIPTPVGNRIHVSQMPEDVVAIYVQEMKSRVGEVFIPFKKLCQDIQIDTVILDDENPSSGLLRYISESNITSLVLGASTSNIITSESYLTSGNQYFPPIASAQLTQLMKLSHSIITIIEEEKSITIYLKLKGPSLSSVITKMAPETCNTYVISRNKVIKRLVKPTQTEGKGHAKKNEQLVSKTAANDKKDDTNLYKKLVKFYLLGVDRKKKKQSNSVLPENVDEAKLGEHDGDGSPHQLSSASERSSVSSVPPCAGDECVGVSCEKAHFPEKKDVEVSVHGDHSRLSSLTDDPFMVQDTTKPADAKTEVERLRRELQDTLAMYNRTCEDLVYAKRTAQTLSVECMEEAKKVKYVQEREEMARKLAEEEKAKQLKAIKEVEIAKQLLAKEAYARQKAEVTAMKESSERKKLADTLFSNDQRYRRYSKEEIERATDSFSVVKKIGEGGYGSVYKCSIDHTPVAVKVLRQDASHKKEEFLREVEVLSQIRHPHMVLLLGACPENGCLVYEYLANGSLEDRLFCKGGTPPLPWALRFRVLYEVACALAFLHSSKPQPIVHRDLKPANILLDRNYVSKIGDVGLAQLMSNVVPDTVTEYRETLLAGTLYYMDPEYQRTGTVRPKSDLYGFGLIILQVLTGKPPLGLVSMMETAIGDGTFSEKLDKSIKDWPLAHCEDLAQLALKCTRLRCRERPDLESEVISELQRFKDAGDTHRFKMIQGNISVPRPYICPILQEVMDDPHVAADGFTYEHRAIKAWLSNHDVSPMTKVKLRHVDLTPNLSLRSAIQEWKQRIVAGSSMWGSNSTQKIVSS